MFTRATCTFSLHRVLIAQIPRFCFPVPPCGVHRQSVVSISCSRTPFVVRSCALARLFFLLQLSLAHSRFILLLSLVHSHVFCRAISFSLLHSHVFDCSIYCDCIQFVVQSGATARFLLFSLVHSHVLCCSISCTRTSFCCSISCTRCLRIISCRSLASGLTLAAAMPASGACPRNNLDLYVFGSIGEFAGVLGLKTDMRTKGFLTPKTA